MPEPPEKGPQGIHTIKSLRLNLAAAENGKTWLLLPEGFRDRDAGKDYPLPARRLELQKLVAIYIPPWAEKQDAGCLYLRRCLEKWKQAQKRSLSAIHDAGRRQTQIRKTHEKYNEEIKARKQEARDVIDEVREEAAKAVASLSDLFSIARTGLHRQMQAYLEDKKINNEKITAGDFRQCARIVTQAVKGLGLPSEQRKQATEAVIEEVAAALKQTQEAIALRKAEVTVTKPEDVN